jgi:hypothetical protein
MRITIISLFLTVFCFSKFSALAQSNSTIHDDARNGDLESLKYWLGRDAAIDEQDEEGKTVLHHAVIGTNYTMVTFLADKGADINVSDDSSMSPLDIAEIRLGSEHPITVYLKKIGGESSLESGGESAPSFGSIWPWLLALVMIGGQIWIASSGEVFEWPSMFRFLGTLAFAAFALMIAVMITNEKATTELAGWEIFEILLTPFVGFISCYLTAHVLETFDKIKENTDRLREAD